MARSRRPRATDGASVSGAGLPEGVRPLDHTADVGMEVLAPALPALFDRAALGMTALLEGDDVESDGSPIPNLPARPATPPPRAGRSHEAGRTARRRLDLSAGDTALLLVDWLREILLIGESENLRYRSASFDTLDATRLRGEALFEPWPHRPVREIKGVTYHNLHVESTAAGWTARIVFDV